MEDTYREKKHLNNLAFLFPTGIKNSSSVVRYCFSFYVAHKCPSLSSIICACLYGLQVYSDSHRVEMLFSGPKHRNMAVSHEEKMMPWPTSLRPWVKLLLTLSSESITLWYIQNELLLNRNTYKNKWYAFIIWKVCCDEEFTRFSPCILSRSRSFMWFFS